MALGNPTEDIIFKIKAEKEDASKSVKSLREELRQAVQEGVAISRQFGDNSKEAGNAAAKVAGLRDEMDDFNQKVKALNPDKFARFATATNGIVNGFQAAQGAAVLFGAESEDLQKSMVKLQAIMAFSQGIQGVLDAKKAFGGLATTIKGGVVAAFTTLRGALIATGIGALAVGVGLLISNFDKVKKYITDLFPGLGTLSTFVGGLIDKFTDFVGITTEAGRALDKMIKSGEAAIKKQEEFLDRNLDKYNKHSQDKLNIALDASKKQLEAQKKFNEDGDKQAFDQATKEIEAQRVRMLLKVNEERKTENAVNAQKIADSKQAIADKSKAERDKLAEENLKKHEDALNEEIRLRDFRAKVRQQQRIERSEELLAKAELDKKDKEQVQAGLDALAKINEEYWAKRYTKNQEASEKEKEFRESMRTFAVSSTVSLLGSLQKLNDTFSGKSEEAQRKAFQRNKALAIAETIVNTYDAAQKAYTTYAYFPPLAIAAAGVAVGVGLANLAAIAKTKFQGYSGDSSGSAAISGSSSGRQAAATGFSVVRPPTTTTDKGGSTQDMKPMKVYVVSKEMTDTQNQDNAIQTKAVIK